MENKVAHLQMIQKVITRMARNSFLIKRWSVTLVAALFALAAANANALFVCLAFFPTFMFWALDAYFLRQERLFQKLYDHVRLADQVDFSMDTRSFEEQVAGMFGVAWSVTLRLFHGTITVVVILVTVLVVCLRLGGSEHAQLVFEGSLMKRAFFSFDFDEDQNLKNHMVGQMRLPTSPFEGADWSMKEAAPQRNWEQEAERRIRRSDVVVVLVGPNTHKAPGVLKEVAITRRVEKPIVQIIGYKDRNPTRVPNAGRLLKWTWENMTSVLEE